MLVLLGDSVLENDGFVDDQVGTGCRQGAKRRDIAFLGKSELSRRRIRSRFMRWGVLANFRRHATLVSAWRVFHQEVITATVMTTARRAGVERLYHQ